jgi:hypothetical protein
LIHISLFAFHLLAVSNPPQQPGGVSSTCSNHPIWDTILTRCTLRTRSMRREATRRPRLAKGWIRARARYNGCHCKCLVSLGGCLPKRGAKQGLQDGLASSQSLCSVCKSGVAGKLNRSDCCALSLQPFRNPVAVIPADEPTRADVFDLLNIVPYVRKFKTSECSHLLSGRRCAAASCRSC